MLKKPVLFSRFFELKIFQQITYFSSISNIKKCWHDYTYFQHFLEHFLDQKILRCLQCKGFGCSDIHSYPAVVVIGEEVLFEGGMVT